MIHVKQIRGLVNNGSTRPMHAGLDSEKIPNALIKTKGNPQGTLALINEIICYHLALGVGIPMPQSGIAYVDETTIDLGNSVPEVSYGSCFYSEWISKATLPNRLTIAEVDDRGLFERIILFDHIIYNKDRNKGNLLITTSKGPKKLYAIDHTHVFKNQTIWDRFCLEQGMENNDYFDEDIIEQETYEIFFENSNLSLDSLLETAEELKRSFTDDLISHAINSVPDDWTIDSGDLVILRKYLEYRVSHIDDMCELISDWMKRR